MTEKRFTLTFDDKIVDNKYNVTHDVHSGYDVAFNFMNILNDYEDEYNYLKDQNEELKSEILMKNDLIQQLRIKLNKDWYNEWKKTIQQYTDVCEELVEANKDYERLKKENEQLKKDVEYWKQVANQYNNELNVFRHCKKYKTECKDIYWSSD